MEDDLKNLKFYPIKDIDYDRFQIKLDCHGKDLSDNQRVAAVNEIEEALTLCKNGLDLFYNQLSCYSKTARNSNLIAATRIILSVGLFTTQTMMDCLVASKFFLLATTDYDRRFMRGKLHVILNEGFKKLYGFNDKSIKKSEWGKLGECLELDSFSFPQKIKKQYKKISEILEKQARKETWWKDERNCETHLDPVGLYKSRSEAVIEKKVILDSFPLLNALWVVESFLENVNGYITNTMIIRHKISLLNK